MDIDTWGFRYYNMFWLDQQTHNKGNTDRCHHFLTGTGGQKRFSQRANVRFIKFCGNVHLLSACRYTSSFRYLKKQTKKNRKTKHQICNNVNKLFVYSFISSHYTLRWESGGWWMTTVSTECRSQCCSSQRERREEGKTGQTLSYKLSAVEKLNTLMLSESWTETEKLQSLLSSSSHYSPSLICSSPKEGESLLCVHLWYSFQFLHPSLHLTTYPHILWCRGPGRRHLRSSDVEDRADAQEEAPEDGPQLRDKVKLHHFTQVGVVAGGMGFELEKRQTVKKLKWACCMKFDPRV